MNIELKNYASPMDSLPKKVADSVQKLNLQDQVIISSFNPVALRLFHNYCPEVPLGLLALPGFGGFWARSFLGRWVPYQALHPGYQDVNATMLHKQHGKGRRINTYTVNHPDEMKRLFALGIDGIITDDPIRARLTLNEFNEERQSRQ